MVYKFLDKNFASLSDKSVAGSSIKNEITQNQQLAEELRKPIIRNFKKRRVYLPLKKMFGCWFSWYAINK